MAKVNLHQSIESIGRTRWNALCGIQYPFLRYEFLHALEASGSVSATTGWQPMHAELLDDDDNPLMLMPLYLKSHSWGEYVFDWAWDAATARAGAVGVQPDSRFFMAWPVPATTGAAVRATTSAASHGCAVPLVQPGLS